MRCSGRYKSWLIQVILYSPPTKPTINFGGEVDGRLKGSNSATIASSVVVNLRQKFGLTLAPCYWFFGWLVSLHQQVSTFQNARSFALLVIGSEVSATVLTSNLTPQIVDAHLQSSSTNRTLLNKVDFHALSKVNIAKTSSWENLRTPN